MTDSIRCGAATRSGVCSRMVIPGRSCGLHPPGTAPAQALRLRAPGRDERVRRSPASMPLLRAPDPGWAKGRGADLMVTFSGLVPCDRGPACQTLVEEHVARCAFCSRKYGRSPNQRGAAGQAPPEPKAKQQKPVQQPVAKSSGQACVGQHGEHGCRGKVEAGQKRCSRCQRRFDQSRGGPGDPTGWQAKLEKLKTGGGRR